MVVYPTDQIGQTDWRQQRPGSSRPTPGSGLKARQRGLSLVEIVVTVALVAIVSTLGIPSFQTTIKNSRLVAETNRFVAHIQLARSEAVKRNRVVSICRSDDGQECGTSTARVYHQGWLVYMDTDGRDDDYEASNSDVLVQIGDPAAPGISIRSDIVGNSWLSFSANGMLDENGNTARYVLCADDESTALVPGRLVTISVAGQPRVTKLAAGASCSL